MSMVVTVTALPDVIPPVWRILTKFAYFMGLACAIGGLWTYLSVVRPAVRRDTTVNPDDAALLTRRALRLAAVGTIVLLVVAWFQLAARVARAGKGMAYADALRPSAVADYLTKPAKAGEWISTGALVTVANVCIVLAALVLLPMLFGRMPRWSHAAAVTAAGLTVAASLVPSIPAKAVEFGDVVAKMLIQAHIIGGSLWVGGLIALALLARTRRHLDVSAGDVWARIWARFGVLALVAVGMVLVSGVRLTYREVGAWEQFVTTPFGRFLLAKIVLVVGLVAAGAYNQLVLMPKIARAQRAGRLSNVFAYVLVTFPRVVLTEVVLGIGVLAIVPFLNGSARAQAAGHEIEGPVMDGGLFSAGLLLVATLAASFYATAKASDGLGRRDLTGEGVAATS